MPVQCSKESEWREGNKGEEDGKALLLQAKWQYANDSSVSPGKARDSRSRNAGCMGVSKPVMDTRFNPRPR